MYTKKELTEEDIKRKFITPAITPHKWPDDKVGMERQLTDGRFNLKGNYVSREKAKKADYLLYLRRDYPIAVIEAKNNNHPVSYGLQQAMTYAQMMDIPFAYSSNGDGFAEHDFLTGIEREIGMDDFPSETELIERFKTESRLTAEEERIINQPYYTDQNTYKPRYYQMVAINRTLDAIAKGQSRILFVMATGTGKTYTAFQIVYRLIKSGMKKKVLYLADLNILVDQARSQDFSPLEKVSHKIDFEKETPETIGSYQVYFSLYHQLSGSKSEDDESDDEIVEKFRKLFPDPGFFDLVIVDECHRGSARAASRWRRILEYFSAATQIGMTATPKETEDVSNISYFGEPVYTYSLRNGIEDGFLAPFRVVNVTLNIGDGWRPYKGQCDIFGNEIEDRIYNNSDYDYSIVIEDRINQVAEQITKYLKATDRMAKTIVFCPTEEAAERMRKALVNANSDMVRKNPDYVVRITGSDEYGKNKLDYFISASSKYPVIATTSKLLSTGVDCKMVKLIVLDKNISSMTEFKQIIGRGTRLRVKEGKTHFTVMDFRGVTRLFADPAWDGEVEMDPDFDPDRISSDDNGNFDGDDNVVPVVSPAADKKQKPIVDKDGCRVEVIRETVSVYDADGKLLRQESITDYTKRNVLGEFATLDEFIKGWTGTEKKEEIRNLLRECGIDFDAMKMEAGMVNVDDFDFICHVAYDQKPLTRKERAENVIRKDFFGKYSGPAKEILEGLLDKYMNEGIYEIENTDVLRLDPFQKYGKPSRIASYFGGRDEYLMAVSELEAAIYSA